ncbi:MAG TPA: hypothetical protein VFQ85_04655 [Mycobacteriales bacterium]|jgi:hypothetical protein|nr:hypothetical protein [Mycobacteriales bacterium]
MNTTTRTAALAALAAGLATTACTSGGQPPTTVITIAPAPAPAATVAATPTAAPTPEPQPTAAATDEGMDEFLRRFRDTGDPKGTPVQFTIRYLNALRAGKWADAVKEMAAVERAYIRIKDNAAAVGSDMLRNAAGGHGTLPRCTSGVMASHDAVVIRCGDARVMVHVETWRGFRGVKVDELFVPSDHWGHPHTDAYTALLS